MAKRLITCLVFVWIAAVGGLAQTDEGISSAFPLDTTFAVPPTVSAVSGRFVVNTLNTQNDVAQGISDAFPLDTRAFSPVGIAVTPSSLDFDTVAAGGPGVVRSFVVRNTSAVALAGNATVAAPFAVVSGGSYTLAPGASRTVQVRYAPASAGSHSIWVNFTGGRGAQCLAKGKAVAATQMGSIAGTVSDLDAGTPISFAQVSVGGQPEKNAIGGTFRVDGLAPGSYAVQFYSPRYDSLTLNDVRVQPGQTTSLELAMKLSPPPPPTKPVVVLVRGGGANDMPWREGDMDTPKGKNEWRYWKEIRERLGGLPPEKNGKYEVWDCNETDVFGGNAGVIRGDDGINANSVRLAEYVRQKQKKIRDAGGTVPTHIQIVAHSMGGLITRDYLAFEHDVTVDKVIMLATPNAGSPLADLAVLLSSVRPPTQSEKDLGTDYVREEFSSEKWKEGVALYLLASGYDPNRTPPTNDDFKWSFSGWGSFSSILTSVQVGWSAMIRLSPAQEGRNDSLVSYYSGLGQYYKVILPWPIPFLLDGLPHLPPIALPWRSACFDGTENAKRDWAMLDHDKVRWDPRVVAWVENILDGHYAPYVNAASSGPQSAPESISSDAVPRQIEMASESFATAGFRLRDVPNDSTETLQFTFMKAGGSVLMTLLDPSGATITSNTLDANIQYLNTSDGVSTSSLEQYIVQSPARGVWKVRYDAAGDAPATGLLTASAVSPLGLFPLTEYKQKTDSLMTVACLLGSDSGTTVSLFGSATVSCFLTGPDATTVTLSLRDDGAAPDLVAGDGVYAGEYAEANAPGEYRILYKAEGATKDGFPFRRVTNGTFIVNPPDDRILGSITEEATDLDGDGNVDTLRLEFLTAVATTGTYHLSGKLVCSATSATVTASQRTEEMPGGMSRVSMLFNVKGLSAADSPLQLSDLELYRVADTGLSWLDTFEGEYSVQSRLRPAAYSVRFLTDATPGATLDGNTSQTVASASNATTVTAIAPAGWHFARWSDGVLTAARTVTNVTANLTFTASFAINRYHMLYAADPNGSLDGATSQTVNHGASGTTVTAVPVTPGYHFVRWSDGSIVNPRTDANVTTDVSVTAAFGINRYHLDYSAGANGSVDGATSQTVNHGASGTTVTAVPTVGYHFTQWSDGILIAARTETNVTADVSVTASFAINRYHLAYSAVANGSVDGATSQTANQGASGTTVTATPATGFHFVQWSDGILTAARTDANVTADVSVTASFAINRYHLAYAAGANGSIDGATSQTLNNGANGTTVTAVSATGYHFVAWSDGNTSNPRRDLSVTASLSVTANFAPSPYTVTFQTDGTLGATLTGTASQTVDYGTDCTAVTANAPAGWHFVKWTKAGAFYSFGKTLTVRNVAEDMTLTATFAPGPPPPPGTWTVF